MINLSMPLVLVLKKGKEVLATIGHFKTIQDASGAYKEALKGHPYNNKKGEPIQFGSDPSILLKVYDSKSVDVTTELKELAMFSSKTSSMNLLKLNLDKEFIVEKRDKYNLLVLGGSDEHAHHIVIGALPHGKDFYNDIFIVSDINFEPNRFMSVLPEKRKLLAQSLYLKSIRKLEDHKIEDHGPDKSKYKQVQSKSYSDEPYNDSMNRSLIKYLMDKFKKPVDEAPLYNTFYNKLDQTPIVSFLQKWDKSVRDELQRYTNITEEVVQDWLQKKMLERQQKPFQERHTKEVVSEMKSIAQGLNEI